jgi:phospholipase C
MSRNRRKEASERRDNRGMRRWSLGALGLLAATLVGCGSSSSDSGPARGDETGGAGSEGGANAGDVSDVSDASDGGGPGADGGGGNEAAPGTDGSPGAEGGPDGSLGSGDGGTCPSAVATDTLASMRAACSFTTGALAKRTLGISDAARTAIPIKNVVVMMKENRAFDHLLGLLHGEGQAGVDAIPASFSNPDPGDAGTTTPFHQTTTCIHSDPDHQWAAMHAQVDNGLMDGFVESAASSTGTNGQFALSYYTQADFPFYYWLAKTYAINDRHFASVRSGTFPNRNFLLLGTADGVMSTGAGYPSASTPTIFQSMTSAGVTWGAYSDGSLVGGTLNWSAGHANTGSFATFLSLLDAGTLPQVAFVDAVDNVTDDHPTADVQQGEAWTRSIYEHATASNLWPHLAILWTYDEGGGFFDHVPPPNHACIARPGNAKDTPYFELGVRVPMVVISPYARANYVSHVVQEHTAITRFIETVFGLPALTSRDANSDALLDLFDFACPPSFLTPPAAPPSGTGGCH